MNEEQLRFHKPMNLLMRIVGPISIPFGVFLLANASEFPMILEGFPFEWIMPTFYIFLISMGVHMIVISLVNRPSVESGPVNAETE